MPVVRLPANVPPPITMSEAGYPIGIAAADGAPAWARPRGAMPALDHRHHDYARHHHHHHDHANSARSGPEYLIPMGTPVPNPYGPGVVFIPPPNARIIPCMPIQGARSINDDELDTIRLENNRNHAAAPLLSPGGHPHPHRGQHQHQNDLHREFARMKLQIEQSERFRMEEFERTQALWDARQREHERRMWAMAMGYDEESKDSDHETSVCHTAPEEDEKIISIHVRRPCKNCKQLVTIETQTVHHRFQSNGLTKGVGINVDSPSEQLEADILCVRCKAEDEEQEKKTELMRKVVREVVDETSRLFYPLNSTNIVFPLMEFEFIEKVQKNKNSEQDSQVASHSSDSYEFVTTKTAVNSHLKSPHPRLVLKNNRYVSYHKGRIQYLDHYEDPDFNDSVRLLILMSICCTFSYTYISLKLLDEVELQVTSDSLSSQV
ncbi:hypothetical protein ABW20_dc0101374 [Dactylellina cionopaga]|nr:hypothetical protein ABW20_dc0101374 [Dactylellina cionopaga]